MTDRERLAKLAADKHNERQQEEAHRQQEEARVETQRHAHAQSDQEKTQEILAWCQETFAGFKLPETNHEIAVSKCPMSKLHPAKNDGAEYVCLTITHWGEATNHFEGSIPLFLARCKDGEYQLFLENDETDTLASLDELRERLMAAVAEMSKDRMAQFFARCRSKLPRRRQTFRG